MSLWTNKNFRPNRTRERSLTSAYKFFFYVTTISAIRTVVAKGVKGWVKEREGSMGEGGGKTNFKCCVISAKCCGYALDFSVSAGFTKHSKEPFVYRGKKAE